MKLYEGYSEIIGEIQSFSRVFVVANSEEDAAKIILNEWLEDGYTTEEEVEVRIGRPYDLVHGQVIER